MSVDDLLYLIGKLTVERELLARKVANLEALVAELEKRVRATDDR